MSTPGLAKRRRIHDDDDDDDDVESVRTHHTDGDTCDDCFSDTSSDNYPSGGASTIMDKWQLNFNVDRVLVQGASDEDFSFRVDAITEEELRHRQDSIDRFKTAKFIRCPNSNDLFITSHLPFQQVVLDTRQHRPASELQEDEQLIVGIPNRALILVWNELMRKAKAASANNHSNEAKPIRRDHDRDTLQLDRGYQWFAADQWQGHSQPMIASMKQRNQSLDALGLLTSGAATRRDAIASVFMNAPIGRTGKEIRHGMVIRVSSLLMRGPFATPIARRPQALGPSASVLQNHRGTSKNQTRSSQQGARDCTRCQPILFSHCPPCRYKQEKKTLISSSARSGAATTSASTSNNK
ncbi:unnamed protein product [Sympodiomycopsis kandeliae]